jgi:ubiquinone/menaquinone biosynthesis C-methylase UbiE
MHMTAPAIRFDDSDAYERFMGRWSRAVAAVFLEWLRVPPGAAWLDVGCGTGALTEALLQLCAPGRVEAVDVEAAQVAAAARGPASGKARFQVADACALPFADGSFDAVACALLINFVPDPAAAVAETRRVLRPGGIVGAYVWDFAEELSPSGPMRRALARCGVALPRIPGTDVSRLEALRALFEAAGLEGVETRTIDVRVPYRDFQDFWDAQTPGYAPTTKIIAAMSADERTRLMRDLESSLPLGPGGQIEYLARANAIQARAPAAARSSHGADR